MSSYTAHSVAEIQDIARDFVLNLTLKESGATVVGLYGDLGAGKTTFTQGAARVLGIRETVVSPTFVIEKIYELPAGSGPFVHLIHIDAYRLETSGELLRLGWREILADSGNLIFIEWPERVADIMPEHISVRFEHISEQKRRVDIG